MMILLSHRSPLVLGLLSLSLLVSCKDKRVPEQPSGAPREESAIAPSHYERNNAKPRVIVFVHGVYGSGETTWKCPASASNWPRLLRDDPRFANSDIYVLSFPTSKVGNLMSIDDVVGNIKSRLLADDVLSHNELVFVCHSMGGLVIERLLLRNQDLAPKVKLLFLISTPQEGAQIAKLGHILNGDPHLEAMLPGDANTFLEGLDTGWRDAHFTIPVQCIVERATTKGILIVERASGTRICQQVVPLALDHIGVTKPCTNNDDNYIAFWNAYHANPILRTDNAVLEWNSYQAVDCDHTNHQTLTASVTLGARDEVTGPPTVELQNSAKIRNQSVKVTSWSGNTAQVEVNFDGETKNTFGDCPGGGHTTVVAKFPIRRSTPLE